VLLARVGVFLKADEYTLSKGKGKFARVCLNVDVTKPPRGTLAIPTSESVLHLPISYEGLHEVCAISGSMTHALEACPESPKNVFEVVVKKFGVAMIHPDPTDVSSGGGRGNPPPTKNWVTVFPKKRSRLPSSLRKRGILTTLTRFPAPKVTTVPLSSSIPTMVISDLNPS